MAKETKLQIVVDAQNRANATFAELGRNLDATKKRTEDLRAGMTAVGTAGTAVFAGLSLITAASVKAASGFEQTTIAFETMIGDAEKAREVLQSLAEFAAKTPFELPQIEETSKRLLAYGVTVEELLPTLEMLGNISAGVGMDKLPQLTLAFGQVRAATKLTGMELRQFSEAGVPLLGALVDHFNKTGKAVTTVTNAAGLSRKEIDKLGASNASAQKKLHSLNLALQKQENRMREMRKNNKDSGASWKNLNIDIEETRRKIAETEAGIASNNGTLAKAAQTITSVGAAAQLTAADIQEMVSKGEVSFEDVQAALAAMTAEGGKFHELMAKQSTSLGGLWSTLKDNIQLTARAVGQELLPYLKPLVVWLIGVVEAVGNWTKANPALTAVLLALGLALSGVLALLLPLAMVLPGLIVLWGALSSVTLASLVPIGLVIAIIGTLIATFWAMNESVKLVQSSWADIWLGIKVIAAESANAVIGIVEGMVNFIIDGVNVAIRAINKVIAAAQKVPGIGKGISKIGELDRVDWKFDTATIAAEDLAARGPVAAPTTQVTVTGNNFLSEDAAEQFGDLLMSRLKLSNAL